jgi:hypothetical protein
MRKKTKNLLLGALGLGALYAGYRYFTDKSSSHHRVGVTRGLDYSNPADARSDKRPEKMYLLAPYQIFNPGGGLRPFEIDAQGAPTGRVLVLPGEASVPGAVVVSGQTGPAIVGGQYGPAIVGGQAGPAIVGNGADFAGWHPRHHHHHFQPPPPPPFDPEL